VVLAFDLYSKTNNSKLCSYLLADSELLAQSIKLNSTVLTAADIYYSICAINKYQAAVFISIALGWYKKGRKI